MNKKEIPRFRSLGRPT